MKSFVPSHLINTLKKYIKILKKFDSVKAGTIRTELAYRSHISECAEIDEACAHFESLSIGLSRI